MIRKHLTRCVVALSLLAGTSGLQAQTQQDKLVTARQQGVLVLSGASAILDGLIRAYDSGLLQDPSIRMWHQRNINITSEWLRVDYQTNPSTWRYALTMAKSKIDQNLAVASTIFYKADTESCADGRFAYSWISKPEWGVHGCRVLTDVKGPLCRVDVINHEFFHLVGVNHGEAGGVPVPTDFYQRTMYHALDSADHLSGLATSLVNPLGNAVSCNSNGV